MDNLVDVVEGPSASLCNRGDFKGTAEWGETFAGERIPELDSRQEGLGKARPLVEVLSPAWDEGGHFIITESGRGIRR